MSAVTANGGRRLVDTVLRARELSILAALVVLVVVTTAANSSFLSSQGVKDIFLNASILALLAVGRFFRPSARITCSMGEASATALTEWSHRLISA